MHPLLRGLLQILPVGFVFFILTGCQEYNPYQPLFEAESLSHVTQLTEGFERAGEASFSHDQRWIVFRGMKAPATTLQLYVAKLNWLELPLAGPSITIERPIPITPPGTRNFSGSFSPDGISLIFSSTAMGLDAKPTTARFPIDMRIFRFDGWEGAISMTDASSGVDLARHPLTTDRAYTGECSFSPDGKWIVFTSTLGGNPDLYVMHADGSHIVPLTKTIGYDGGASFSPDGKHLVYHSLRYTDNLTQIFTADLAFDHNGEITGISDEHQLTNEDSNNTNPAWHPDGIHIVYTTSRHGRDNYELYLMTNQGRRKTRITYSPGADLFPVFSPDGKWLMWASKRAKDGSIEVYAAQFQFPRGS
jgi:Tol biopolymer transport system component